MSAESHLAELERRHAALEREIAEAMSHPSSDTVEITELKRKKLLLKDQISDQISRMRTGETVH